MEKHSIVSTILYVLVSETLTLRYDGWPSSRWPIFAMRFSLNSIPPAIKGKSLVHVRGNFNFLLRVQTESIEATVVTVVIVVN